ncbi:uncharacterized protein LOC119386339 [Rhipicephalus sanguineus]|uniref:uncharacterized protein LOC119386339 n=1 Tax=Rhipicephalus sanguineus TaxID=34632 RepID=UPI0020C289AF|nr:uncharacterized protein LOC119386339 [Rhipicephalus sanguineus]
MSPLQSDIAPWLGFLQWRLERAFRRHMNELLAIFSRLYDKAKADYVQGKELNFVHAILAAREEAIAQDRNDAVYLTERNLIQVALNLFEVCEGNPYSLPSRTSVVLRQFSQRARGFWTNE